MWERMEPSDFQSKYFFFLMKNQKLFSTFKVVLNSKESEMPEICFMLQIKTGTKCELKKPTESLSIQYEVSLWRFKRQGLFLLHMLRLPTFYILPPKFSVCVCVFVQHTSKTYWTISTDSSNTLLWFFLSFYLSLSFSPYTVYYCLFFFRFCASSVVKPFNFWSVYHQPGLLLLLLGLNQL